MAKTVRMASCHPELKCKARGLCNSCYEKNRYRSNSEVRARKKASAKRRYDDNPEFIQDERRFKEFGLTTTRIDEQFKAQNGVCAICEEVCATGRRMAIDHNHALPKGHPNYFRGLLCARCNLTLGRYKDDPIPLLKAAAYLLENTPKCSQP